MLSVVVFLPLTAALVIACLIKDPRLVRGFAVTASIVELCLSGVVFVVYSQSTGGYQLEETATWVPFLGSQYHLGVDGLSAPLVLLTGLLGASAMWASLSVQNRVKEYFVWLLILQTAVMGVFTSLDLLLFFVFWELELVPMYFLIAVWGSGRREYSAMKFLLFTITAGAVMLVGILVLYFSTGTFSIAELGAISELPAQMIIPASWVFGFFFLAFAIKLPTWPVHTWLPDAHTDAPTGVSIMLAGVLLKMGGYGLIRVNVTMFPELTRDFAWLIAVVAVITIIYGAMITVRQNDLKRLVAFSSVSHMGFVLLGISSLGATGSHLSSVGLTGASLQMFTHGTITGLLFLLVGLVYERAHTRYIPDLGGLASRMPFVACALLLAGLASLGLPGLSGFPAEALIFLGTFPVWSWATSIGAFSIVIAAGYILWMIQRTLFGVPRERFATVADARLLEAVPIVGLMLTIIVVGLYPQVVVDVFAMGADAIVETRFGLD